MLPWVVDTPFWDHTANHNGGTPRIYTVDGAAEVADAIIWDTIHPLGEYAVGWKAMGTVLGARVWPELERDRMRLIPRGIPARLAI